MMDIGKITFGPTMVSLADKESAMNHAKAMSTEQRIAALERDLAEANSLAHSRAMTIERLEGELAAAQQRLFAFYSGNPTGGIVASLERALAAAQAERDMLIAIKDAADVLYSEAEEFDFDDGLGMGASQQYWDDLANALFPDDSGKVIQADLAKIQASVDAAMEVFEEELTKSETLPCGHHHSLMLKSAETGEPLYCELCDMRTQRDDFETELNETKAFVAALQGLHAGDVETLKAEAAALREDAERYRWLTEHRLGWFSRMAPIPWKKQTMKDALDAAIDAARGGDK